MIPFDLPEDLPIVELSWPTRIVLGPGALARLPAHLAALGVRRPLVVADPGIVKAGLAGRVHLLLEAAGMRAVAFDEVQPNPTDRDATLGLAAWRRGGCDGLVAVGGGSSIDAAKLVQLLATHEPPLSRYDDAAGGDRFVRPDLPPLVAIPTTAGTGSEVGRSAVVTLPETGRKTVIFSPHLMPRVAICDPRLTVDLPAPITAATGMDAFTHGLEAYLAAGFHPLADALAIDAVRRATRSLPVAYRSPGDLHARTDMMVAAIEGATAFQKGLGAAHALAHALGPISRLHHGLANAVVLPHVVAFLRPVAAPAPRAGRGRDGRRPRGRRGRPRRRRRGAGPGPRGDGRDPRPAPRRRRARGGPAADRREGLRGRLAPREPAAVHGGGPPRAREGCVLAAGR